MVPGKGRSLFSEELVTRTQWSYCDEEIDLFIQLNKVDMRTIEATLMNLAESFRSEVCE